MSHLLRARRWLQRSIKDIANGHFLRQSTPQTLHPDLEYSEELFNYTRGHFVCNEQYETSQRHVSFNVDELARRAAEAVGAKQCVSISKYPEGMYNKSMLLSMDDGSRVVAKVPNPNAGLPHFTTASEVATMDFARNVLGTPVPKVLAWCSRAHETPVGTEYIIMEEVTGIELECVWPDMRIEDRVAVMKAIAGFHRSWTSISFKKYGSLYFSRDLDGMPDGRPLYVDTKGTPTRNTRYAVGPSTAREFFDFKRAIVNFDRGPWDSLEAYHEAIGHREIACVNQLELPKPSVTLCGPRTYRPTKAKKMKAMRCYLTILRYLLPQDQDISSAHLWHDDLHVGNIFVNPSDLTKIVSLIDWQSTELSPLYFHARRPPILDYIGPSMHGLQRPKWREDFGRLEPSEQREAEVLFINQGLSSLYNTLIHGQNPRLYAALHFQDTPEYMLLLIARKIFTDGEVHYLSKLAELESTWTDFIADKDSKCPFTFSDSKRKELEADLQGATRGMDLVCSIKNSIGELFPEKGLVRHDQYYEALNALSQMKEQVIEHLGCSAEEREIWEKEWPFGN